MVSIDRFPGMTPFWGLGQLPPEALWLLWERRMSVLEDQLALASRAWSALRSPSPEALFEVSKEDELPLPYLAAALRRHLAELPDRKTGLSLTQKLILEILAEGEQKAGQVFRELMMEREPLPWLGDLMFWAILKEMTRARVPVLVIEEGDDEAWPKRTVKITDLGLKVLAGQCNYLDQGPTIRWVGGVEIVPSNSAWCWNNEIKRLSLGGKKGQ